MSLGGDLLDHDFTWKEKLPADRKRDAQKKKKKDFKRKKQREERKAQSDDLSGEKNRLTKLAEQYSGPAKKKGAGGRGKGKGKGKRR